MRCLAVSLPRGRETARQSGKSRQGETVAETADLKSLARNVLQRDTARDSERDSLSRGCLGGRARPRQGFEPVSVIAAAVETSIATSSPRCSERCPEHVERADWQQAVADGRRFLADGASRPRRSVGRRGTCSGCPGPGQAGAELSAALPLQPNRLGLAIAGPAGGGSDRRHSGDREPERRGHVYRRHNKPALGPVGDSLDDIDPSGWQP